MDKPLKQNSSLKVSHDVYFIPFAPKNPKYKSTIATEAIPPQARARLSKSRPDKAFDSPTMIEIVCSEASKMSRRLMTSEKLSQPYPLMVVEEL
jgi:hypothetical protein